jgi:hypothetical protein
MERAFGTVACVDTRPAHFYIPHMPRRGLLWLIVIVPWVLCAGCESTAKIKADPSFGPTHVRIHPTFTQVKDWTGDGKLDGIEVVVELLDDFDEPVRAPGKMTFELFRYLRGEPNPAGDRLVNPWVGSLLTREEQAAHWSPALRAYTFQLAYPQVSQGQYYVLSVTFESAGGTTRLGGGRLFNQIILEPLHEKNANRRRVKPVEGDPVGGSRG